MSIAAPAATSFFEGDGPFRLSVAQYHQMVAAGILTEDDPVELLEGVLVPKTPKNPLPWLTVRWLRRLLEGLNIAGHFLHCLDPVTSADSEPEPDLALVAGQDTDFLHGNPTLDRVPLVIEIADTTLTRDRKIRKRIYAKAGVPVYWIVNLIDRHIEVYTAPITTGLEPGYAGREIFAVGSRVSVMIAGVIAGQIEVAAVFPPVEATR
jgi:Uma2 family endonuclease